MRGTHIVTFNVLSQECRHPQACHCKEDSCLLNDGMSMSKRVSFKRKRSESSISEQERDIAQLRLSRLHFPASLQTETVTDAEALQKEALARAKANHPQLPGQSNLKRSNSLPVTTTSASRNPALYCGHATQSRHNRMEQRPTTMPTASTPAVDSDDFMLFLHHMIDLVDDDNNTRGG